MTGAVAEQHGRFRQLVGQAIIPEAIAEQVGGVQGSHRPMLLHICRGGQRDVVANREAIGVLVKEAGRRDCSVQVCFGVVAQKSGANIPSSIAEKVTAVEDLQHQEDDVREFRKRVQFGGPVLLFGRDADVLMRLKPRALPVNVLIDKKGNVVEVLSGSSPEVVRRLIRMASSEEH
jgi:hypothetical protein